MILRYRERGCRGGRQNSYSQRGLKINWFGERLRKRGNREQEVKRKKSCRAERLELTSLEAD